MQRSTHETDAKTRIGQAAAELLAPGETTILDGGTATLQMVRSLNPNLSVTVITSSLLIATELDAKPAAKTVVSLCRETGQREPSTPVEVARVIFDSLAVAYASAIQRLEELTGRAVTVVHLVGGGSRSDFLAQLTADACQRDVVAGPAEAAVMGNALVQAATLGDLPRDRWAWRRLIARDEEIRRFTPRSIRGATEC